MSKIRDFALFYNFSFMKLRFLVKVPRYTIGVRLQSNRLILRCSNANIMLSGKKGSY